MSGTLYGIGTGPGDPELLTVKATCILRESRLITYFAKQGGTGRSRASATPYIAPGCEELPLYYPLTIELPATDPVYMQTMGAFYDEAAARLGARLEAGEDVTVLCEGDPLLYGSFMHLHRRLHMRFRCHVIPGITAMAGAWSASALPMTWGADTLTVLPATLPEESLRAKLAQADAAVIMKIGRHLPKLRAALRDTGLLPRAVYVEYATLEGQRILPLEEKPDDIAPYFSLVLIPGEGRRP